MCIRDRSGTVTSNTENPAPPLPYGAIKIVRHSFAPPTLKGLCINKLLTTGDPSTPYIAFEPPSLSVFKSVLIIVGKFPANKGGTKPHSSCPVFASKACNIPSLAPTYNTFFLLEFAFAKAL